MNLSPEQQELVRAWAAQGDSISDIQTKLASECGVHLSYMDTRFLLLDLSVTLAEKNAKKAEQIGRRELAKLCVAAGKPLAKDSAELVDAVVEVKVVVGKNYNGEPDNEAKDFRKIGAGGALSAPSAGMMVPQDGGVKPIPAAAPAPANTNAGKLPWMK